MDKIRQDDHRVEPLKKNGDKYASGRIKRMLDWLRRNEERIRAAKKGKVTLDFAGERVTARFEDVQDNI